MKRKRGWESFITRALVESNRKLDEIWGEPNGAT